MDITALWDAIGWPEIQILTRQSRIEQASASEPVTTETVFMRRFLEKYNPTWSHNKIRINMFTDTWNVWVPLPNNQIEESFLDFLPGQDLIPSFWRNYDEQSIYLFTSHDIYLDANILHIERRQDTLLTLISDVGGVYKGLTIIGSLFLFSWQTYNRDRKLASSLLLERDKDNASSDRKSSLMKLDTGLVKGQGERRPSLQTEGFYNWARKRFQSRSEFYYPTFCRTAFSACFCCRGGRDTNERLRFAA